MRIVTPASNGAIDEQSQAVITASSNGDGISQSSWDCGLARIKPGGIVIIAPRSYAAARFEGQTVRTAGRDGDDIGQVERHIYLSRTVVAPTDDAAIGQ